MADASRHTPPPGWNEVFAALPLEAPPASRWTAIEAELDDGTHEDRHAGMPWPKRFAWAAVLAAVALPAALWLQQDDVAPSRTPFARTTASPASAAPTLAAPTPAPHMPASQMPASQTLATAVAPAALPAGTAPAPAETRRTQEPAVRIAQQTTASVVHDPAPASQAKPWPRARVAMGHGEEAALQAAFEPYYAESARLERVIASARDPRVGSGPAASLAGALDAELATVDARLAQPGLDTGERLALWRERVEVLRASAEFESQLRLLAVEGDVLDGALVRID